VPYCGKCGFQVTEEMQFCPNCGTRLKTWQIHQENARSSAELNIMPVIKDNKSLTNGILIGSGAAILVFCILGALFLNANFWSLRDSLLANGVAPSRFPYILSVIALLTGFCAGLTIFGVYFLAEGILSQTSPTARAIFNSRSMRARWGNGFIVGAVIFAMNSIRYFVENFYLPELYSSGLSFGFGIASIILLLIGFWLIVTTHPK